MIKLNYLIIIVFILTGTNYIHGQLSLKSDTIFDYEKYIEYINYNHNLFKDIQDGNCRKLHKKLNTNVRKQWIIEECRNINDVLIKYGIPNKDEMLLTKANDSPYILYFLYTIKDKKNKIKATIHIHHDMRVGVKPIFFDMILEDLDSDLLKLIIEEKNN